MYNLAFLGNIGWQELLILLAIALLLFGSRLPEVARSMGKSVVEFKKGLNGVTDEIDNAGNQTRVQQPLPPAQPPAYAAPTQAPAAYAAPGQAAQADPYAPRDQAR